MWKAVFLQAVDCTYMDVFGTLVSVVKVNSEGRYISWEITKGKNANTELIKKESRNCLVSK